MRVADIEVSHQDLTGSHVLFSTFKWLPKGCWLRCPGCRTQRRRATFAFVPKAIQLLNSQTSMTLWPLILAKTPPQNLHMPWTTTPSISFAVYCHSVLIMLQNHYFITMYILFFIFLHWIEWAQEAVSVIAQSAGKALGSVLNKLKHWGNTYTHLYNVCMCTVLIMLLVFGVSLYKCNTMHHRAIQSFMGIHTFI